jgi:solute carrier family 25 aspartate/glutamate transporter 12/13
MTWTFPTRTVIHNDEQGSGSRPGSTTSAAASAVSSVRQALAAPQSETTRWRKTFDTYAKEVNGEKCVGAALLLHRQNLC